MKKSASLITNTCNSLLVILGRLPTQGELVTMLSACGHDISAGEILDTYQQWYQEHAQELRDQDVVSRESARHAAEISWAQSRDQATKRLEDAKNRLERFINQLLIAPIEQLIEDLDESYLSEDKIQSHPVLCAVLGEDPSDLDND